MPRGAIERERERVTITELGKNPTRSVKRGRRSRGAVRCDTSDCRLPPSLHVNPFFSPRLGRCRLGGFDTRPSRAVIKPRPDSYLNGQLSLDLDSGKSIGFCEPLALKPPTRVKASTSPQLPVNHLSISIALLLGLLRRLRLNESKMYNIYFLYTCPLPLRSIFNYSLNIS